MGIAIARFKTNSHHDGHANAADDFATGADGRLLPLPQESFELMPLGSLDVLSFSIIGQRYSQNPSTVLGMLWEVGFSKQRLSFFSPETTALLSGVRRRPRQSTLGFYYYNELRSLSLGSIKEPGGAYVSMIFAIQATADVVVPLGVRVHGQPGKLKAFATLLTARCTQYYDRLRARLKLDLSALGQLFEVACAFDFLTSAQVDLFITAAKNTINVHINYPLPAS